MEFNFTNRDESGLETTVDGYGEQQSAEINYDWSAWLSHKSNKERYIESQEALEEESE